MRIGILGGTGPAGSALAARLASVGYDVVIGSRSKYRAMEVRDGLLGQVARARPLASTAATTPGAADCDLVVIATPWDSAATTAQENADALAGKVVVSMANALVRVGHEFQPLVPPRGSVAAHVQAAVPRLPRGRRVPPPAGQGARPPRRADRLRRADLRRRPEAAEAHRQRDRRARSPAAARSRPASCPTPRRSRRSPPCCCSSTCATRPASRRSSPASRSSQSQRRRRRRARADGTPVEPSA